MRVGIISFDAPANSVQNEYSYTYTPNTLSRNINSTIVSVSNFQSWHALGSSCYSCCGYFAHYELQLPWSPTVSADTYFEIVR
jgi:hypothetical protein